MNGWTLLLIERKTPSKPAKQRQLALEWTACINRVRQSRLPIPAHHLALNDEAISFHRPFSCYFLGFTARARIEIHHIAYVTRRM